MTNSTMIIDSYHDPELYKLVDKQFKKDGQQQRADAYEIRLDNKSTLSATQLFYNVSLTNEIATNMRSVGTTQDLNKY